MKGKGKKIYTRDNSSHQHSFILVKVGDGECYPECTALHCLYDGFKIDGKPGGCPIKCYPPGTRIRSNKGEERVLDKPCYACEGIFCSLNCALSYAQSMMYYNSVLYSQAIQLLQKMFFEIHPESHVGLRPANKKVIKEYGGDLTIEQFRASFEAFTTYNHRATLYPCAEMFQVVAPLFSQRYSSSSSSSSSVISL